MVRAQLLLGYVSHFARDDSVPSSGITVSNEDGEVSIAVEAIVDGMKLAEGAPLEFRFRDITLAGTETIFDSFLAGEMGD